MSIHLTPLVLLLAAAQLPISPIAQTRRGDAPPARTQPAPRPEEAPVLGPTFRFGDFDGDGLEDVLALRPSAPDRLFRNLGDGTFLDVTPGSGLDRGRPSRLALWEDFDLDGHLDLYLSDAGGARRLLRGDGRGLFLEGTLAAGLEPLDGPDLLAEWTDYDLDGLPDLHLVVERGDRLYHNLGGGLFERAQLPAFGDLDAGVVALLPSPPPAPPPGGKIAAQGPVPTVVGTPTPDRQLLLGPTGICAGSVQDQTGNGCLEASSDPTLGMLMPLSTDFNLDGAGNVGIGTTSPGAKLEVAGAIRAQGMLVSTATSGAPLAVSSSALVSGLNADLLDGLESSAFTQLGQSIDGTEIVDGSVRGVDVLDGSLTGADLGAGTVTGVELGAGAVNSSHIASGAVTTSHIAVKAVDGSRIAPDAVDSVHVADGAIGSSELSAGAVGTTALAVGAVDATSLQAGAVSPDKLDVSAALTGSVLHYDGTTASWAAVPGSSATPIDSLPVTITQPGSYYLTGDLTGVVGQEGIQRR